MKPSAAAVLDLLRAHPEGCTHLDALYAGCGSRLAGRVHELRAEGFDVTSEYETTANGARIVRYRLHERPAPMTGTQLSLDSPGMASAPPPQGRRHPGDAERRPLAAIG